MIVFRKKDELNAKISSLKEENTTVGFVPTMGALHQGHISLIKRAVSECDAVVVSIFVNPLQFAPNEDLAQYPRTLEADSQICQELGVKIVFAPSVTEIGIAGDTQAQATQTTVTPPESMMSVLCGKHRPGHFIGVATIVTKLFNIVKPDRAYFGQKDAQQAVVIKTMVEDLNIPVVGLRDSFNFVQKIIFKLLIVLLLQIIFMS